ncbi:MAG: cyclic nucleotide-binding domain-containing protein [Patescibacteria group bacterium]|nr:cyclic nucleotide-binding domain-containing protein [Patescibacteria group bacterium]
MAKFSLSKIPIFNNLSGQELKAVSHFLIEKKYLENDLIFKKDQLRDRLLIIDSGLIALENGHSQTIALFKQKDSLGEMAFIAKNSRHQYNLRCFSDEVKTRELFVHHWPSLIKNNPRLEKKILNNIAYKFNSYLEHANNKLITLFSSGRIIASYQDPKDISRHIINAILEVVPSQRALFLGYYHDLRKLHVYRNINYSFFHEGAYIDIAKDKILQVLAKEPDTVIFDAKNSPRVYQQSPHFGLSTIISPLILKNKVLGFIILSDKKNKKPFSLNNKILLEAIAGQVAPAIDYHQNKKIEQAKNEIKKTYIDPFTGY